MYIITISRMIPKSLCTYEGYGKLFGPKQSCESDSASPHRYFNSLPPLHFAGNFVKACDNIDKSTVAICNKIKFKLLLLT